METNAQNALPQVPKSLDNKPRIKDNETENGGKTVETATEPIKATDELREHILKPEPYKGGDEIRGGHEKSAFLKELGKVGGKVVKTTPSTQIDGVEIIEYALPKYDKAGNPTGEFKSKLKSKTVFVLNRMSLDEYISRGLEAANNYMNNNTGILADGPHKAFDKQGVEWLITFRDGKPKTLFPAY
ncbi:MAG: hypothetical protein IJS65_04370 [Clostridia bacterium]|nr:hypothetical protein [Clostridia bacterium]